MINVLSDHMWPSHPHLVSPRSDRIHGSLDHIVMMWAPGQTPEEPKSRIWARAVSISCSSQQCIPAPASPLQWRQSLPRTHCHGCRWATPLRTTMLLPDTHTGRRPLLPPQDFFPRQSFLCFLSFSLMSSSLCFRSTISAPPNYSSLPYQSASTPPQ